MTNSFNDFRQTLLALEVQLVNFVNFSSVSRNNCNTEDLITYIDLFHGLEEFIHDDLMGWEK